MGFPKAGFGADVAPGVLPTPNILVLLVAPKAGFCGVAMAPPNMVVVFVEAPPRGVWFCAGVEPKRLDPTALAGLLTPKGVAGAELNTLELLLDVGAGVLPPKLKAGAAAAVVAEDADCPNVNPPADGWLVLDPKEGPPCPSPFAPAGLVAACWPKMGGNCGPPPCLALGAVVLGAGIEDICLFTVEAGADVCAAA